MPSVPPAGASSAASAREAAGGPSKPPAEGEGASGEGLEDEEAEEEGVEDEVVGDEAVEGAEGIEDEGAEDEDVEDTGVEDEEAKEEGVEDEEAEEEGVEDEQVVEEGMAAACLEQLSQHREGARTVGGAIRARTRGGRPTGRLIGYVPASRGGLSKYASATARRQPPVSIHERRFSSTVFLYF